MTKNITKCINVIYTQKPNFNANTDEGLPSAVAVRTGVGGATVVAAHSGCVSVCDAVHSEGERVKAVFFSQGIQKYETGFVIVFSIRVFERKGFLRRCVLCLSRETKMINWRKSRKKKKLIVV